MEWNERKLMKTWDEEKKFMCKIKPKADWDLQSLLQERRSAPRQVRNTTGLGEERRRRVGFHR
jgi:hypothetical protein